MQNVTDIISRYSGLFKDGTEDKNKRVAKITNQVILYWQKLKFPIVTKQQVRQKYLIRQNYASCLKKVFRMFLMSSPKLTLIGHTKNVKFLQNLN